MAYRTPDVYVKEISLFPPSVAEVETAIPAFIGYTEKAGEFSPGDLKLVPKEVKSMLEYNSLFGGPPPFTVDEVVIDENNSVSSYKLGSTFYMYDSLRLFFENGGGKCYVISIGTFKDTPAKGNFEEGLKRLKKKDEPTIILFPDAVLLEGDIYILQQAAIRQCDELKDRFAVFDLLEEKKSDVTFGWQKGYEEFRDRIGMNNLKYGAAYTPWIKAALGGDICYKNVKDKLKRGGTDISWESLTDDVDTKAVLTTMDDRVEDLELIEKDMITLRSGKESIRATYSSLVDAFAAAPDKANLAALFDCIYDMTQKVDDWAAGAGAKAVKDHKLTGEVKNKIKDALKKDMTELIGYDKGADKKFGGSFNRYKNTKYKKKATEWDHIFDSATPGADEAIYQGDTEEKQLKAGEKKISEVFARVNGVLNQLLDAAGKLMENTEEEFLKSHAVFRSVVNTLKKAVTKLPPSGAIAGVYAMVDNARGVWKAPANVSVSGVSDLTVNIDSADQEDLNIDTNGGKSINALRAFTGKGILVWGARTLAGNDNEWRYIPVRRFFNMVEESVKKSTYWAVFEPNDANTWIKVKSMIENYLTQKWRDGALAGAKADDAFYVKVGLGLTMTSQDILEGRMNVEIGMAAVKPAEFIILKFSHMMQRS